MTHSQYAQNRDQERTHPRSKTQVQKIVHGSITEEREFLAPLSAVFNSFGDAERRRAWFRIPGEESRNLDFRVGGSETLTATTTVSGVSEAIEYRSHFIDIVEPKRIVFHYTSVVEGLLHASALVAIELVANGSTTFMTYTDHYLLYVYPSHDESTTRSHHEGAIRLMLNGLSATLR